MHRKVMAAGFVLVFGLAACGDTLGEQALFGAGTGAVAGAVATRLPERSSGLAAMSPSANFTRNAAAAAEPRARIHQQFHKGIAGDCGALLHMPIRG